MASSPGLAKQRRELIKIWLKWRLALAGMIILIVALYGGGYVVSDMSDKAQEEKQAAVQDMLQMVLATVGKRFKTYVDQIDAAVDPRALGALVAAGDAEAVARSENELAGKVKKTPRVRLLPSGIKAPTMPSRHRLVMPRSHCCALPRPVATIHCPRYICFAAMTGTLRWLGA